MPTATQNNRHIGTASALIVKGSWLGVATAAKTKMPSTMPRHHDRSRRYESTPMKLSSTTTSGNSNDMPKTSSIINAKPRYELTVMMAKTSFALTPRKNAKPLLKVM